MQPDDLKNWLMIVVYAGFAAIGGFMGYLMRTIDKEDHPISWGRAVIEAIAAGFVGVLVLFVCLALNLSQQWTGVIVGVSGWLGANASIRLLERVVYKKIGMEVNRDDNRPTH